MKEIAIDLGTASTLAFVRDRGIVVNEPTVVALERATARVVAVGRATWKAAAASPETVAVDWPFRRAAVSDFAITERIIAAVLRGAGMGRLAKPRALLVVPSAATEVERRAVDEAALAAGVREVWLIDAPMAAAIGAGLPVEQPRGSFVLDVGGAATEIAVISMNGIVASRPLRVGSFDLDELIHRWLRREYGMSVGDRTAEGIKIEVGSAAPLDEELKAEIRGRELSSGAPKTVVVGSEEVRGAMEDAVRLIVEGVRVVLSDTPPELAQDVLDGGISIVGGGGMLRGLGERISVETGIPAHVGENPLEASCRGAGRVLDSLDETAAAGIVTRRG
jgi:rod shape-determining protein MreB